MPLLLFESEEDEETEIVGRVQQLWRWEGRWSVGPVGGLYSGVRP